MGKMNSLLREAIQVNIRTQIVMRQRNHTVTFLTNVRWGALRFCAIFTPANELGLAERS